MADKRKAISFFDYSLVIMVMFIAGVGLVMMYSASGYSAQNQMNDAMYFFKRQFGFALVGLLFMLLIGNFLDYHWLLRWHKIIYILSWIMVILTFVMGIASHGQARWIKLGPIRFQPSEIMKIAVILSTTASIRQRMNRLGNIKELVYTMAVGIVPMCLIAKSNLSTALIIGGITMALVFVATKSYKYYVLLAMLGAGVYVGAYPIAKAFESMNMLQSYQLLRIFAWKDPASYSDETFQTLQGLYAIGSGGIFGKGLGESVQKFLMPEAQNDMIFTIICEELGLFGAVSIVLMYAFVIWRLYSIARDARDMVGSFIVLGIMVHISLQVILNIAVATNVVPNTGVTLPFISYGGTSLLILMSEMGIALNVSKQTTIETVEE
jgi:cell division protein FtsW